MSDFGYSVYGLINFGLILIRNYIFLHFDTFVFVSEDSTAIFCHSKRAVGRWHSHFLLFEGHVVTCVVIW